MSWFTRKQKPVDENRNTRKTRSWLSRLRYGEKNENTPLERDKMSKKYTNYGQNEELGELGQNEELGELGQNGYNEDFSRPFEPAPPRSDKQIADNERLKDKTKAAGVAHIKRRRRQQEEAAAELRRAQEANIPPEVTDLDLDEETKYGEPFDFTRSNINQNYFAAPVEDPQETDSSTFQDANKFKKKTLFGWKFPLWNETRKHFHNRRLRKLQKTQRQDPTSTSQDKRFLAETEEEEERLRQIEEEEQRRQEVLRQQEEERRRQEEAEQQRIKAEKEQIWKEHLDNNTEQLKIIQDEKEKAYATKNGRTRNLETTEIRIQKNVNKLAKRMLWDRNEVERKLQNDQEALQTQQQLLNDSTNKLSDLKTIEELIDLHKQILEKFPKTNDINEIHHNFFVKDLSDKVENVKRIRNVQNFSEEVIRVANDIVSEEEINLFTDYVKEIVAKVEQNQKKFESPPSQTEKRYGTVNPERTIPRGRGGKRKTRKSKRKVSTRKQLKRIKQIKKRRRKNV